MKGLGSFALPIVGLAVCITLAQSGQKPRNVDEVYALLEDRLHSLELRLQDTDQSLNAEKIRSRNLEVKVRRLERERNRYKGSEIPVVQGEVCGVSCQIQLDILRSGMITEKHRASQADKAVRAMKSRLQNLSTRVDAVELDSQRLMVRANETGKMIDIIRRRSDDLSTKLGAISLKAELSLTNSYQTNQTVQELKAVIGNHSARIDVTDRKCDSLMKRTNHKDQTATRNTTVSEDHTEHGAMADYLRRATDVEGAPTSRHRALSIATCPGNTTVVGCRCSHQDRTCDGVIVYDRVCKAVKSYHGSNLIQCDAPSYREELYDTSYEGVLYVGEYARYSPKAHAKCVHGGSFVVIKDPEDGMGYSSQPLARCPSHTRVAACWLYNERMHRQYVETRLDRGGNSCTVSQPCVDAKCWIKALCREN